MKYILSNTEAINQDGDYEAVIDTIQMVKEDVEVGYRVDKTQEIFWKKYTGNSYPNAKLNHVIEIALGRNLTPAEQAAEFDLAQLRGKKVRIILERKQRANGKGEMTVGIVLPTMPMSKASV